MNELGAQNGIEPRQAALSLAAAGGATMLALANYTAPTTTVPETAADLGAGVAGQVWILGGIALGLAALLLVAGGLADGHGRRRVFVIGAGALAGALAVGALATTTWVFVAARIVQGGPARRSSPRASAWSGTPTPPVRRGCAPRASGARC